MKYIVYLTLNKTNNKIYIGVHQTENPDVFDGYIGCGVNIKTPSTYKNSKTAFQYAVNKYGVDSFRRYTLKIFETYDEAYKLEEKLVTSEFIKRKDTYNMCLGGIQGKNQSKLIYEYSLDGIFIKEWDSIAEAARHYKCSDTAISNAIAFNSTSNLKLWSEYKMDQLDLNKFKVFNTLKNVYKYNNTGELIGSFDSIKHAADDIEVKSSLIGRAIKGGYKVKGFNYSLELVESYSELEKVITKNKEIHFYDEEGKYVRSFNTIKEIIEEFKLKSSASIYRAIRLNRPFLTYQISLEKQDSLLPLEVNKNKRKKVNQYDLSGNFIRTFDSITEACKIYGTGVQKVIRGQKNKCKNFIFKLEE